AFLFSGINILTSAMFTALSNGTISAILAVSRNLLIALGILALPRFLGVDGVWLAVPFAELVSLAMAIVFIVKNRKRYHYA
ncbi:MAG: MATE family efflux transporter, partial [Fibrobacteraceae bacterium]